MSSDKIHSKIRSTKSPSTCSAAVSVLFIFFALITLTQPAFASEAGEVIYLNSYHDGLDWADEIADGISDSFKNGSTVLYTEYMDTKQYPGEENYNILYSLYQTKYKDRNFDAVITSDDNALNFVLKHKDTLFPETPVIFCGVNEVSQDFQHKYPNTTGYLEHQLIEENILTAIEINPNTLDRLYLLTDDTQTGASYRSVIDKILPDIKSNTELIHIYDISMAELLFEAANMPDDSAILYVVFNRDGNGELFTNEESVEILAKNSRVPVYVMVENYVGLGPAGGIVMSPYSHGYITAERAKTVISGTSPSEIKIEPDMNSYPLYDYNVLTDFGYDISKLPENATIINEPESSVEIPSLLLTAIIAAGVILFLVSVLLSVSNRRTKITAELLKTSEERLSMAMKATRDGLWDWNYETENYYTSPAGLALLGYIPGEITITPKIWKEMIHPDDIERVFSVQEETLKNPGIFTREYRFRTKSGGWKWIRCRGNMIGVKDNAPTRVIGTITDIDETVKYRNALVEANRKMNILSSVTRHDILNQVTALMGYLEIMDEIFDDEKTRSFISKLKRPARTIQQQINFTKDYQEMGVEKPEWQNVSDVAKKAAKAARDENTRISIDTGNVEVFADLMLEKVFFNLFDNAKRHGKTTSEIKVSFRREEGGTGIITVGDNGQGVEPEKKDHIFEKGFGGNSGYGLFLVENILGITNIKIRETGTYKKCARFEIVLPGEMWHIPADISDI